MTWGSAPADHRTRDAGRGYAVGRAGARRYLISRAASSMAELRTLIVVVAGDCLFDIPQDLHQPQPYIHGGRGLLRGGSVVGRMSPHRGLAQIARDPTLRYRQRTIALYAGSGEARS